MLFFKLAYLIYKQNFFKKRNRIFKRKLIHHKRIIKIKIEGKKFLHTNRLQRCQSTI